jgi:hypothetical protein
MELKGYDLIKDPDNLVYEFYSEGPRGKIKKHVRFQPLQRMSGNAYNLAFGDADEITGKMDDMVVSNNKDRVKVLQTVATVVVDFLKFHPQSIILVQANTLSRIRLYQMGISANLLKINQHYEIYAELENEWFPFQKGINYERFLLFKKIK